MSETNNEIKLGSIPTREGYLDRQGYKVYSIYGISVTITSDGGIGHNKGGLIIIANHINSSINKK